MEKTFNIGYGVKFFTGRIRIGTFTVDADDIETVQKEATKLVLEKFEDDFDEYEGEYLDNIQSINIDVTEEI